MPSFNIDKSFFYEYAEGSYIMPSKHYHNRYEIYFLERGCGNYFIDDKSYEVKAGDIVFISPATVHKTVYDGERARHLINCSSAYIPPSACMLFSGDTPIFRNAEIAAEIPQYFQKIQAEYKHSDMFSSDTIHCLVRLMLIFIAKKKNQCSLIDSQNDIVSEVAFYIKNNLSSELKLSDIAKQYIITPQYLSSLFKKKTGIGFHEYINLLRMLKAEELLTDESRLSISEISEYCGFNDSNYFSHTFKKHFGITPSEMRCKNKKQDNAF